MAVWGHPEFDGFGHVVPGVANTPFPLLTTSSLVLAAGAGSTASVTSMKATDMGGSCVIASAGTGQAAGVIGTLTFANPWYEIPAAVVVNIALTNGTTGNGGSALTITASSFQFAVGTALVAASSYSISWVVVP